MNQPWLLSDAVMAATAQAPATPVAKERARLNAAALRVLARLKEGPATNYELSAPEYGGLRFGGRLKELRDDGWDIATAHVKGGTWTYTLHGYR